MTAETDLLSCPFCGAAEPIVAEHSKALPPIFRVICSGGVCHAVVEGRTLVRAKLMWNRRACVSSAAEALRAEVAEARDGWHMANGTADLAMKHRDAAEARAARLAEALRVAEAALADIGDADREPGDDVAWCERRAAQALPTARAALEQETTNG